MSAGLQPPPAAGDPGPAKLCASAKRFGRAGAGLYPLLGQPTSTPSGPALRLQVFGES